MPHGLVTGLWVIGTQSGAFPEGVFVTPILGEIAGWEGLLLLLLIALLFGSSRLPQLARSLGQATKEFRQGVSEGATPDAEAQGEKRNAEDHDTP
jgi:sec-independent protein translocase protein TatA